MMARSNQHIEAVRRAGGCVDEVVVAMLYRVDAADRRAAVVHVPFHLEIGTVETGGHFAGSEKGCRGRDGTSDVGCALAAVDIGHIQDGRAECR